MLSFESADECSKPETARSIYQNIKASKLFQSHNFKKSLEAYQDCVDFCRRTQEEESVVFNILSTKATLEYILGEYDKALSTLNSVLNRDHTHFLCLLRRSQVYKKVFLSSPRRTNSIEPSETWMQSRSFAPTISKYLLSRWKSSICYWFKGAQFRLLPTLPRRKKMKAKRRVSILPISN